MQKLAHFSASDFFGLKNSIKCIPSGLNELKGNHGFFFFSPKIQISQKPLLEYINN